MAGWFEAFGNFAKGAQGGFDRYQALRQLDVQNQLKLRQQALQEEAQKYDNQYRQRQMEQLDQAVLGLKQKSFEDTHSLGNQLSPEDVSTAQGIGLSGLMNKLPQYGDVQNTVLPSSLGRPLVTPTITDMSPTPEDRYIYSGNQAQQQSAQSNAVDQQVKMLNVQKMLADARKTQSEAGINQALMNILNGGQPQQSTGTPSLVPPPSAPSSNNSVPMGGYLAPPEPGNPQTNSLPIPPPLGQAQLPNAPPTSLPNQSKPFGGIDLSPDDIKSIIGKKFFGVDLGKSDPVSNINVIGPDHRIVPFDMRTKQAIELPPGYSVYEKPTQGGSGMSPEAIAGMINFTRQTGNPVNSFGMNNVAGRNQYWAGIGQAIKGGADFASIKASVASDTTSQKNLQTTTDRIGAFKNGAAANMKVLQGVLPKMDDYGSVFLNTPMRELELKVNSNSEQGKTLAQFRVAANTYLREYARLTNNLGQGILSDSARTEAMDMLNKGYTVGQFMSAMDVMTQDMDNVENGMKFKLNDIQGRFNDRNQELGGGGSTQTPPQVLAAGPGIHTFNNGQTWTVSADGKSAVRNK